MDKNQIIHELYDKECLIKEITDFFGSFDSSRWSLDAGMDVRFEEHMKRGLSPADFYINEEGFIYQSCWNCATNSERDKYTAMKNLALDHKVINAMDYGCAIGTGVITLALEGIDVVGKDICKPSLQFLRARAERYNLPNIEVFDINKDISDSRQYDLVICTEVLEHVKNPLRLAKELAAVTKPGGLLILSWSFVDMTTHLPENFYLNTPHPDQLETAGFGKFLVDELGLGLDRRYGNGSGYLWFNNSVWRKS